MRKKHAMAAAIMAAAAVVAVVGVLSWLLPQAGTGAGDAAEPDASVAEPADAGVSPEDEWPGKEGPFVDWGSVIRAFEYVLDLTNVPEVVNMSFAGPEDDLTDYQFERIESLVHEARTDYGIVCVAASGNSGKNEPLYPGAFEEVVCVGSVDSSHRLAADSTRGEQVDMCAPGVGVYTTTNPDYAGGSYYGIDSGTSFAGYASGHSASTVEAVINPTD